MIREVALGSISADDIVFGRQEERSSLPAARVARLVGGVLSETTDLTVDEGVFNRVSLVLASDEATVFAAKRNLYAPELFLEGEPQPYPLIVATSSDLADWAVSEESALGPVSFATDGSTIVRTEPNRAFSTLAPGQTDWQPLAGIEADGV